MLCAENFGVAFDDQWVFRGLSLLLEPGQRVALVGPSGCGKSMLLKTLAMLQAPSEGSLTWGGQSIEGAAVMSFRSQVMYVPQKTADDESTVDDYLKVPFGLKVHQQKTYRHRAAVEMLRCLGREEAFLKKQQRELSGGERQIAALVRAMLLDPKVLLLDEPTSALDGPAARAMEGLVLQWCDESEGPDRSLIWVTHDREQAERIASKVVEFSALMETDR